MAATDLKLKVDDQPSYFNKDTLLGGLIGVTIGGYFPIPIPFAGDVIGLAMGGALGAVNGKARMENEILEGKKVHTPSYLNKEAIIGGLGAMIGANLALLAAGAVALGMGVTPDTIKPLVENFLNSTGVVGAVGILGTAMAYVAAPFIGAVVGARSGKERMEQEFAAAIDQKVNQQAAVRTQSKLAQMAESLDPQIGDDKEFAQRVVEARLAQSQTRTV